MHYNLTQKKLIPLIFFCFCQSVGLAQWQNGIILWGTICTMNDSLEIIQDGRLLIDDSIILAVLHSNDSIPAGYENAIEIATSGYIYPGLMDLHSHPKYNILSLWNVPQKYATRSSWRKESKHKRFINKRINFLADTLRYRTILGIYAEVKAMAGGATTLQGLEFTRGGITKCLVRNTESYNFGEKRIAARVDSVKQNSKLKEIRKNLESKWDAWFYHLAEGTDSTLRGELYDLEKYNLNLQPIVGIHCTALRREDFHFMSAAGMKMVWSPLSNLLLYGQTADVRSAKQEGVLLCLGSDWSPTGSKNILWELKVAHLWNQTQLNNLFTPQELVQMVTTNPAKALKWENKVGSLKAGLYADVMVTQKLDEDPYLNLIRCTEEDVQLVIIDGEPYYGDLPLMQRLKKDKSGHDDFAVVTDRFASPKAVDVTRKGLTQLDFKTIDRTFRNEMTKTSFPAGPVLPDPIYTVLDTSYFQRLWSIPHNPLNTVQLAAFVFPTGRVTQETKIRSSPSGQVLAKLPPMTEIVIINDRDPSLQTGWYEILAKADNGRVYRGVTSKADIEILSRPR